jgi:hypothetical protein
VPAADGGISLSEGDRRGLKLLYPRTAPELEAMAERTRRALTAVEKQASAPGLEGLEEGEDRARKYARHLASSLQEARARLTSRAALEPGRHEGRRAAPVPILDQGSRRHGAPASVDPDVPGALDKLEKEQSLDDAEANSLEALVLQSARPALVVTEGRVEAPRDPWKGLEPALPMIANSPRG